MLQLTPKLPQTPKSYSWAGHCRFKINTDSYSEDNSYDEEEEKYDESSSHYDEGINSDRESTTKENKDCLEERSFGLKCQKPSTNTPLTFSKYNLHSLKPIKETYVSLRNERILQNMKIRRPRYVHLYSHPLKKITSVAARKLRSLKNMKLLSLRDYGYEVGEPSCYYYKEVEREEAENGCLCSESVLTSQELSYLLSNRNTLRKLYVMLNCENWKVFKRIQSYARRQKNLQGFGFILDYQRPFISQIQDQPRHFEYDISPLGSSLKHLEMRFDGEPRVQIKGLNKLRKLSRYTYGKTCGLFPSAEYDYGDYGDDECEYGENFENEDDDNDDEENGERKTFGDRRLEDIFQISCNKRLENIKIKIFELRRFERDFWSGVLSILNDKAQNVKLTYEIVLDPNEKNRDVAEGIQDEIHHLDYQGTVQILVLDDFDLGEYSYQGYGLKTYRFNFDKEYLFGIEKYHKKKVLSLSKAASVRSSHSDVFDDIAYIGYVPGLH